MGVCVENKGCQLVQISNGQIVATIPNAVTASWSPKGKQIACGDREGVIRAFDISGALKDEIAPPTSAQGKEGLIYCHLLLLLLLLVVSVLLLLFLK